MAKNEKKQNKPQQTANTADTAKNKPVMPCKNSLPT